MKRVLDWIFTIPFLVMFAVALFVFDPLLRLARLFGVRAIGWVAGVLQWTLVGIFRITGTRISVERSPLVKRSTGYVIVANHQSLYELPLFGAYLFSNQPRFISKLENGKWFPSISYHLRRGGNGLIDRKDRRQSLTEIKRVGEQAQRLRLSMIIFPEGTRGRDGALQEYKQAGTLALLRAAPDLDVLPVALDGGWKVMKHNFFPIPFGTRLRMRVGDPIPREADEDRGKLIEQARRFVDDTLNEWRGVEASD
ncbi:MAG: lysophospholipid acyltransferase family protein [Acidimicrobiia bacterium]